MNKKRLSIGRGASKTTVYTVCILLALLSVIPFWIMFINATRNTPEISNAQLSLLPSTHIMHNWNVFVTKPTFNPITGFINSLLISTGATALAVYFSSLTAYGIVAYTWRARKAFFGFIMAIMMIPAQLFVIGFYQFMYKIGLNNNLLALILPSIAAPAVVFFMRQYLLSTLSVDMVEAARIDGSNEFRTFNRIVLPIMKPAIATQAIFSFVTSWNALFMPMVLLTKPNLFTMPIMVSLLRGDIYKQELGSIYLGLAITALPLFIIYFLFSRYIIRGIALGGVKE